MTRVLIADDHPFMRTGVEAVLRGAGIDVVATADDGDAALAAIARHTPDVAILDIRMPGRNGIAVLEAMRQADDQRPVILLTAELTDEALLGAVKAGVDGIVFKDGAETRLVEAVRTVVAGQPYISEELQERAQRLALESPRSSPLASLTARERQIALEVARGRRNREIAELVGMTEGSIKVYLHNIYNKLGIENRTELAIIALETGYA
ncbi:MAG: response regulator transcription factor [Sphingomonadales bacterium]|nr:response regulator transcription factor [Sphingomonadales bacterium]